MLAPYRKLFATLEPRRLVAASLRARLAIGAFGLPLILTVAQATGSYATAGLAAGGFSLGVAAAAPVRGRLVDHHTARRALPPMIAAAAAALLLIALLSDQASASALVALSTLAGATTPPLVASMRLEWQRMLGAGDDRLVQAYAFESSAQTAMFVVGPILGGIAIAAVGSPAALAASAGLLAIGTCAFAALARSAPAESPLRTGALIGVPGVLTLVLIQS